ncbi:MAG: CHASE2 domain-containing protein [Pseudomonadota bacterium]
MARKAASRRKSEPSSFEEAVVRSLTGLAFGMLVAVIVVTASVLEWRPIKLLQSWGSDIGLRIFADPTFVPNDEHLRTDVPFVFLDIDGDACRAFLATERAKNECSDPSAPPPDLLAALVEGIDSAGAAVTILDYRLPNPDKVTGAANQARLDALKDVLTAAEGVPIIAPAPLDPVANVASVVDQESDRLVEGWAEGRLRLAAFMTWADPEARDGVVRGYPAVLDVQRVGEETTLAYLPSAPFLAALITEQEAGLAAADALFYAPLDQADCDVLITGDDTVIGRSAPFLAEHCGMRQSVQANALALKPQIFSIYSLSLPSAYQDGRSFNDERLRALAAAYYGSGTIDGGMLYRRYRTKDFIGENGAIDRLFRDVDFGEQIVVIGTSAFDAGDWHRTSVGALAGAEVIINAARAFSQFSPLATKESFWSKLLQSIQLTGIAAFALFFFTWAAVAISRRNWITKPLSLVKWWHYPLAPFAALMASAVYLAGIGVAIVAVSFWTYGQVTSKSALASFDFLLPVIAVAFEGLVEISHGFLNHVHQWVNRRVSHIKEKFRTIKS